MDKVKFAESTRNRTKNLTLKILELFRGLEKSDETRIIGNQLIRSSCSVTANYRAVCRARSRAEFYSKVSIVVEEADETLFWLEILKESNLANAEELDTLISESTEILSIMAKARKSMSSKR